ncbi:McrC family protein [Heyndrickxia sp. NPDC080065]|uniref:McrC family protein n=1 Tax=Heyndrickxia sp. NPDC080065 TaxID=3390568 RepID=UPI003D04C134
MKSTKMITMFEDRTSYVDLTNEQKNELQSLESIWGSQNLILRADNRLLLKKYVGFVASRNLHLQILPKIFRDENLENIEIEKEQSIQLLFRLLSFSNYLKVKELPTPMMISKYHNDILEVFIGIFIREFLNEYKLNVHRQYESIEENIQFIKGKILFQKSLLRNHGLNHQHYVKYEEFTEDTLLNQIFKTTIVRLLGITKIAENKKLLKVGLLYLQDVQTINLNRSIFKRIQFNKLNAQYLPIFNLAKLFYHNQQAGFSNGPDYTFTFLIPLNELFEYTVYKMLSKIEGYSVLYQKPQKYLDEKKKSFKLKPDITIYRDDKIQVIVDAKYKNPIRGFNVNVSQTDIYQMLAYALAYNCKKIFLIYPVLRVNQKFENPLEEYEIETENGVVKIFILHVDICRSNLDEILNDLMEYL